MFGTEFYKACLSAERLLSLCTNCQRCIALDHASPSSLQWRAESCGICVVEAPLCAVVMGGASQAEDITASEECGKFWHLDGAAPDAVTWMSWPALQWSPTEQA